MPARRQTVIVMPAILMIAFLSVSVSSVEGQEAEEYEEYGLGEGHREEPDDPYLPPAFPRENGNQSSAPAGSVQVNVNAAGMNIPGDAANEPSICIDPNNPNRMAIGFRQFDNVASNFRQGGYAYSINGGQTWTFPGVLEPGVFRSDPVLDVSSTGIFYYNSLQQNFTCDVFRSLNGGQTWPFRAPAFGGDKQWMAVDRTGGIGEGNIYAFWSGTNNFTRSTNGGVTWMTPIAIPNSPALGTLIVGPDGELYVAGRGSSGTVVAKSTNAKNPAVIPTWDSSVSGNLLNGFFGGFGGPNPGGLLGQAWVTVNQSNGSNRGHVYLLASVFPFTNDPQDVHFSRSTDGGQTWSPAVRVNDDPIGNGAYQWFGTMSVAPNGRIDVVWNDTRGSSDFFRSRLYYSYSLNEGVTWTPNVPLTPEWDSSVGWPNQNKIGDYYHMISDNTGANLAYSATFNGEQDVFFMRIIPGDCNNNGVPDDVDIANGTSQDCNDNGFPDECEVDCNDNGIEDSCDVADGTSPDCNANGIPDECDPDCNNNDIADSCDISSGHSQDLNGNGIPDECDPDFLPPQPNPMTFFASPAGNSTTSITMTATVAIDNQSPPVRYFFDYVSGFGGHDSGWQLSETYTDTDLSPNSFFNYRVKARDNSPVPNETLPSAVFLAGTHIETPEGVLAGDVIPGAIAVSALGEFSNLKFGNTGFYFEITPPDGQGGNVWVPTPSITITGLQPCGLYTIRVKARNFQSHETAYSAPVVARSGCLLAPGRPVFSPVSPD